MVQVSGAIEEAHQKVKFSPDANEYCLVIHLSDGQTFDFPLADTQTAIGRDPACGLVLRSAFVSRRHAAISRDKECFALSDIGSTNGTFVNGQPLRGSRPLVSGDRIALGDVLLEFVEYAADAQGRTPIFRPQRESPIVCDTSTWEVWVRGTRIEPRLSRQEFELLNILAAVPGIVRGREELGKAIWGEGNFDLNMLHRLVHRLRQKLGKYGGLIESVAGAGYRLTVGEENKPA